MSSNAGKLCAFCSEKEGKYTCSGCKSTTYCCTEHQKSHWKEHKGDCQAFKISSAPELGRFLEATRDISKDSFILTEVPLVIGPKWNCSGLEVEAAPPNQPPVLSCVGCFQPLLAEKFFFCKSCRWPTCSPECAGLTNPSLHGIECHLLSLAKNVKNVDNLMDFVKACRMEALLAIKCLMLQAKYPKKWQKLMEMESHFKERKGTPFYEEADKHIVSYIFDNHIRALRRVQEQLGKQLLDHDDTKTLHKICGIIEVNSMAIPLSASDQELYGLYATGALLQHSCMPNCTYDFDLSDGFKIIIRAGRDIKKGEHLTTSYTNILLGTVARREHLKATKYFVCKCVRCTDKTELGTYFSALKCLGTEIVRCEGIQLPEDPLVDTADWVCSKCPNRMSNEQVGFIISQMADEIDQALSAEKLSVENVETLIDKLSQFLHPNHFHLFTLKHALIQLYGYKKDFFLEQLTEKQLKRKLDICKQLKKVIQTLDPQIIRLQIYFGIVENELALTELELTRRQLKTATEKSTEDKLFLSQNLVDSFDALNALKKTLKREEGTNEGKHLLDAINNTLNLISLEINKL